jgi:hypothetical protein
MPPGCGPRHFVVFVDDLHATPALRGRMEAALRWVVLIVDLAAIFGLPRLAPLLRSEHGTSAEAGSSVTTGAVQ